MGLDMYLYNVIKPTMLDERKIYETDGSHGCINLPKDIASKIYENVSIGTVVEVY